MGRASLIDRQPATRNLRGELKRGREAYRRRDWADAFRLLAEADKSAPLAADDLELLATSAALSGRDAEFLDALDRAHHARLDAGENARAARLAFWLGLRLAQFGETGRATGWFARAERLVEREAKDCVERGYLLLPVIRRHQIAGNWEATYAAASEAAAIGERCGEKDLVALARNLQGKALVRQGQIERGLALLDEAMVAVASRELSPIVTGLIYCSVIDSCQRVYALSRAREWTAALAEWCAEQPQLVTFSGICLVHRAEIMQLEGAWRDAAQEVMRASERNTELGDRDAIAPALYQKAELLRLQGDFAGAEAAYRETSQLGSEPQPGLALLRLAQGRGEAAAAAIRRVLGGAADPLDRAKLLPAYVEIMLATSDVAAARVAADELRRIATSFDTEVLDAIAAHAIGAVRLAEGDAKAALPALRRAFEVWQRIGAPYIAARIRVLVASACRDLGDMDGAALELQAARSAFEELGAVPDIARIDAVAQRASAGRPQGLTPRELQVLRLVAAGKTNKAIARELSLSEKTIDRHVSNIFVKLDVPTRAAATAYAYEHRLI